MTQSEEVDGSILPDGIAETNELDGEPIANRIAEILGVADDLVLESLRQAIIKAREVYETGLLMQLLQGSSKEQKKILSQLRGQLLKAHLNYCQLSPEIAVAVGDLAKRSDRQTEFEVADFGDALLQLSDGIDQFLAAFTPPKGPSQNGPLEMALREVLPVIEKLAGGKAAVKWNKNNDKNPEPANSSSRAVIHLFRNLEKPPSETTILDMIAKVQKNPEPAATRLDAVIRAHSDELDLSLLPSRHERGDEN